MFGKRNATSEARVATPATKPPAPNLAQADASELAPTSVPANSPPAEIGRRPLPSDGLGMALASAPIENRAPPTDTTVPSAVNSRRSEAYYKVKSVIFSALIEAIDLAQLSRLDADLAREEIRDIVNEIIAIKNIVMSISEQEELLDDICNDVLGLGPLEPLLARDDISDVMVNGSGTVYIEVQGKIQKTGIRFRDNQQLLNICQRIVSQIGRRVDESPPDL